MGKPGLNSRGTHPAAKPAIGRFGPVYAFRRIKARRWLRLKNRAVRPGMRVFRLSSKTGEGMEEYLEFLAARLAELRSAAAAV
jgi:hypothetical protein